MALWLVILTLRIDPVCSIPPLQTIGALDEKKREALEKTWRKVCGRGRDAGLRTGEREAAAMWWVTWQG